MRSRFNGFVPSTIQTNTILSAPPHEQYYNVLVERYPALFGAIGLPSIIPTAGVINMVRSPELQDSYSPYKNLLSNLGPPAPVPLAGTNVISPPNRPLPKHPLPYSPKPQPSKNWFQRFQQWLRQI